MTNPMPDLTEWWGLGTVDIARALDIPQRIIKQARDNHAEEAAYEAGRRLNDFLADVYRAGVKEPAGWMGGPVVEGFTVTRWHLYAAGRLGDLLDNARGLLGAEDMLARFDGDWRRTYWNNFKTVEATDGGLSVVGKTYDEVRAQMEETR
ncbi:MAG TPA: hypothetical protein VI172_08270 [Candidatus Dormibacteraeota bacterium]|jgi:hypothetical protein